MNLSAQEQEPATNGADLAATLTDEPAAEVEQTQDEPDTGERSLAEERGWVDKDHWRGQGKWVDFKQFNRVYESREPQRLRREAQSLRTEVETLRAEVEGMRAAQAEQQKARDEYTLQQLQTARREAREQGDHARADELADQILELRSAVKAPAAVAAKPQQQVPAHVQAALDEFSRDNPIFDRDPALGRSLVIEVGQRQAIARQTGFQIDPVQLLREAGDAVMRRYPEKFERKQARPPMAELSGAPGRATTAGARNWNNLTQEARTALEGLIETNVVLKKMGTAKAREEVLKHADDSYFRK